MRTRVGALVTWSAAVLCDALVAKQRGPVVIGWCTGVLMVIVVAVAAAVAWDVRRLAHVALSVTTTAQLSSRYSPSRSAMLAKLPDVESP